MNKDFFRRKFRKEIDFCKPLIEGVRYITHPERHEKKISYGKKNSDKTIYIIRNSNPKAGLFSLINSIMEKMEYALDKGYYPIVDMMNYPNSYLAESELGKENAWEYYFEPLMLDKSICLETAYKSKNVVLSSLEPVLKKYHFDATLSLCPENNRYRKAQVDFLNYFRIKDELVKKYENIRTEMFGNKSIVGVLCRGTDYAALKPYAHPIQPDVDTVIKKADEVLNKYSADYIYISTEDESIVEAFKEKYGKKLLLYPRRYVEAKEDTFITDLINDKYTPKEAGIDYLGQIYLLTKCQYAVLSLTSATPFVRFMSDYKYVYIWNLGRYGFDD